MLASAGLVIDGQVGGIVLVLVFGAGTDYALLLVARYREELRRSSRTAHDAMRTPSGRPGPAIIASAATVVARRCSACSFAERQLDQRALGPVGAIGVLQSRCSRC